MIIGQQHLETSNRTFNKLPRASENNGFHSPFHPAHLLLPSSLSVSYSAAQNSNSDRSQVKQMPPPADKIKKRNKSIFKDPPPFHSTGLERKSVLHQMAIKRRIFLFCPSLCCSACLWSMSVAVLRWHFVVRRFFKSTTCCCSWWLWLAGLKVTGSDNLIFSHRYVPRTAAAAAEEMEFAESICYVGDKFPRVTAPNNLLFVVRTARRQ